MISTVSLVGYDDLVAEMDALGGYKLPVWPVAQTLRDMMPQFIANHRVICRHTSGDPNTVTYFTATIHLEMIVDFKFYPRLASHYKALNVWQKWRFRQWWYKALQGKADPTRFPGRDKEAQDA
jgi:hypothetical protein